MVISHTPGSIVPFPVNVLSPFKTTFLPAVHQEPKGCKQGLASTQL